MTITRKLLTTLVVVGAVGAAAGFGAYSAFTATTTNTGNSIAAGTVKVDQHAGATTLYTSSGLKPADTVTKCVRVTYSGSLAASLKIYVSSGITNGTLFNLKIDRGSGMTTLDNTMSCAGFTADVTNPTAYDGDLGSFGTTYALGSDGKDAGAAWAQDDAKDYRLTLTVNDDTTANAHTTASSSGSHTFTFEARNN
jgi:hypothetical protein